MLKQHADKCAAHTYKYDGDMRNPHVNPNYKDIKDCDCDGYHTFTELYNHRITLYLTLCAVLRLYTNLPIWRSKRHSDGELCFGTGTQFVLGISQMKGRQITYHIPIELWDETNFAITYEQAPEWDGHTSDQVIERLKTL